MIAIPSLAFLGFTAVVAALYYIGPGPLWRRCIFAIANIVFLAGFAHTPAAFIPFAAFLVFGYCALALIQRGHIRSSTAITIFVVTVVVAFVWLKKYSFVPSELFLAHPYTVVGLSYIFFRILHLIVDAGQEALPERVGLLDYIGYTLNFCSLVSGPIQRYDDYAKAGPATPAQLDVIAMGSAAERIIIGFFKVSIVSAILLDLQHQAMSALTPDQPFLMRASLGLAIVALYPLYLYANFSGYTDFVIGAARFLGIILPENFNRPFTSGNFIDFWGRWHITLSSWLKTYVYSPFLLALMRRVPSRGAEPWLAVSAFFLTFFLVGVWHGQTSEFLFFGLLQGGGVAGNKLFQIQMTRRLGRKPYRALCDNPAYRMVMRGLTFAWFAFTLLWFWSNWQQLDTLETSIGGPASVTGLAGLIIVAAVVLSVTTTIRERALGWCWSGQSILLSRYTRTAWGTALAVISVSAIMLIHMKAPDIVYQAF